MKNLITECVNTFEKKKAKIGNFLTECYSETTYNNANLVSLNETNAKRLIDKHSQNGYVIISPCRGADEYHLNKDDKADMDKLANYNRQRVKDFISFLKKSGWSYTPTYGGFIENKGTENEEQVYERSFVVYNRKKDGSIGDFNDLYKFAIDMCNRYNQDSVLIKAPNEAPKYITGEGNVDMEFSNDTSINDVQQQFFTDLHKNTHSKIGDGTSPTRFTFLESYINPSPQCYSERVVRANMGEIYLGI